MTLEVPEHAVRPARLSLAVQTDKATSTYRQIASEAEAVGFDGVSAFGDLGFQPPVPALLAMASCTKRIRLGAACLNSALVHPVEIAGQMAALSDASNGRAYLGLARGAWLGAVGIHRRNALARLEESIQVIRRLLAGDDTGYRGAHFTLEPGFRLRYPTPHQPVELLIGTWGPRGAALAARHAAEVKLGGCANPKMVTLMHSWLAQESTVNGRLTPPAVVAGAVTVVDRDRSAARRRARTEVAMYVDVVGRLDRTTDIPQDFQAQLKARLAGGDHAFAGRLIPDDVLDLFAMAGTPDDVAAHAATLIDAGADRVEFGTPHGLTHTGGLALLATQVLPAVRAAGTTTRIGRP